MYAIVKTGGKQYRVEQGQWLLVERLPDDEGATVSLQTLLVVDGETLVDGEALAHAKVEAKVLGHERGPKLRVVKFKPKRGYKRRNGHRQELTRIEIASIATGAGGGRSHAKRATPARAAGSHKPAAEAAAHKPAAKAAHKPAEEAGDGA